MSVAVSQVNAPDCNALARIHLTAFPKSVVTAFGAKVVKSYYEWQTSRTAGLTCLIAVRDSQVCGYALAGSPMSSMASFIRSRPLQLMIAALAHPQLILDRTLRARVTAYVSKLVFRKHSQPTPESSQPARDPGFWIEAIAVDSGIRRAGIGSSLMAACEDEARRRGCTEMFLAVETGNDPAIALYEKMGWSKVSSGPAWNGKMRKRLPGSTAAQRADHRIVQCL
jgi:ribosomal protein S18 acetylase RimI-like enzyme